ncbi:MAG: hypothetical protein ACH350_02950 [Parachlamydiaceae bacterium]
MLKLVKTQLEAVNGGCRGVNVGPHGRHLFRKLRRERRRNERG